MQKFLYYIIVLELLIALAFACTYVQAHVHR